MTRRTLRAPPRPADPIWETFPHIPDGREITLEETLRNAQRLEYLHRPPQTFNPNKLPLVSLAKNREHPGRGWCEPCWERGEWTKTTSLDRRNRRCCGDCFVFRALQEYRSP